MSNPFSIIRSSITPEPSIRINRGDFKPLSAKLLHHAHGKWSHHMRMTRVVLSLILSSLVLAGCGGLFPAGDDGGTGSGTGTGVSPSDKRAAAQSVVTFMSTLKIADVTAFNTAVANQMRRMPAFRNVSIHDGIVEASFMDGQPYAVLNNFPRAAARPSAMPRRGALKGEVPSGSTCAMLNSLGNVYTPVAKEIAIWMRDAGYTPGPGDFSVKGLIQACAANDVIFLQAHGGIINHSFWLMTSDRPGDPETDAAVLPYLKDGSVIISSAPTDVAPGQPGYTYENRYLVGVKFAEEHLHFKQGSLYVNFGCLGLADPNWLAALEGGGLSAYVAWTKESHDGSSTAATKALFDHLLGSQLSDDYTAPDQRPFDIGPVCADLTARGLFTDPVNGGKFVLRQFDETFGLIRPTIKNLTVKGYERELWLDGDFGTRPGEVTIGGTAVALLGGWSATHLEVQLPDSGAGSSGDVLVTVSGHKSNAVPLTHWEGDFLYTDKHTAPFDTVVVKAKFHVSLRADAREFREVPHGGLTSPLVSSTCDRSSTCHWWVTGQEGTGPNALVWSGTGDPVLSPPGPNSTDKFFQIAYTINPKTKKLQLGMILKSKASIHVKGGGVDAFQDFGFNVQMFDEKPGPFNLPTVDIDLANDYSIPADLREYTAGTGASYYSLVWLGIDGTPAPDDTTQHRPRR